MAEFVGRFFTWSLFDLNHLTIISQNLLFTKKTGRGIIQKEFEPFRVVGVSMMKMSLERFLDLEQIIELKLAYSVDPDVKGHWDGKILSGIVPTEVKMNGPVDNYMHTLETRKLADFEFTIVSNLFAGPWRRSSDGPPSQLHYFGIGTAEAFARVADLANRNHHRVVAYESSSVGYDNGRPIIEELTEKFGMHNKVLMADIEFACKRRYIPKGAKLICSRVLDVLDKEDKNWERRKPHNRKMARTARKIGKLLRFSEILLINPCPQDNPNAIWGDTTPHSFEEITGHMKEGLGSEVELTILGKVEFHKHIYTAGLIKS